ncbi:plasmid IncI1-type surface exclusion protein ExcA [Morganella psychrotolerans]|uniref:plasmid IncI1-type surface exclusion protein ExcA n=1 Tax=Morganella psychrotolerans TaxID=368603 RepID=UPI0039B04666
MTQRLKTPRESRHLRIVVFYVLVCLPICMFIGLTIPFGRNGISADPVLQLMAFIAWMFIILPVAVFIYNLILKRIVLTRIVRQLKHSDYFNPQAGNETFHLGDGKYFGIDISNGTMLYIHRIRKGEIDILALDMKDWTNSEAEGQVFRLYTKRPELPRIAIATPFAQRWFDTVGAMVHRQYPDISFNHYIRGKFPELESENNIHISPLI